MARISNADAQARIARVRQWMAEGLTIRHNAHKEGIKPDTLARFRARHGMTGEKRAYSKRKQARTADTWGRERADPSVLTPEQIVHAFRVGINPARYAWLLQCPKGGNAIGWKGGNAIG